MRKDLRQRLLLLSFEEWLFEIDSSGSLICYVDALEENYDNIQQIIELYVLPVNDGWSFDRQFFDDLGISDSKELTLFETWFVEHCRTLRSDTISSVAPREGPSSTERFQASKVLETDNAASKPQLESVIGTNIVRAETQTVMQSALAEGWIRQTHAGVTVLSKTPAVKKNLRCRRLPFCPVSLDFAEWLWQVGEGTTRLSRYQTRFERNFPDVDQLLELYVHETKSKDPALDEAIFIAMSISHPEEQQLFRSWFKTHISIGSNQRNGSRSLELKMNDDVGSQQRTRCEPRQINGEPIVLQLADCVTLPPEETRMPKVKVVNSEKPPSEQGVVLSRCTPPMAVPIGSNQDEFCKWISDVDPNGALNCYVSSLAEAFDDVQQITNIYGTDKGLDARFFEDLGVKDRVHQALFQAWFLKQRLLVKLK